MEYACNVEGNLQSVKLSNYVDKPIPARGTEIHADAVDRKKVKSKPRCCDVKPARQKTGESDNESWKCDKCGLIHRPKECPAFGKWCYKCGKDNHYARLCCRTKRNNMDAIEYQSDEFDNLQFDAIDTSLCDDYEVYSH